MGKAFCFLMMIGLCSTPMIFSQEVEDSSPTFTLGFAAFSGKDLEPENVYLVKSIPLLLRDAVSICKTHTYSEKRLKRHQDYLVEEQLLQIDLKLEELLLQKDAILFNPNRQEEQLVSLEEDLLQLEEQKTILLSYDPASIEVENPKTIEYRDLNESEVLFPPPVIPLSIYTRIHGLDFLIGGTIEEVEGYFYISVFAFSRSDSDFVYQREDAISGDTLDERLADIGDNLITRILGREWGHIFIETLPEEAEIYLDGTYLGTGTATRLLLETGQHTVTITAEGHESYSGTLNVNPFTDNSFSFNLEQLILPQLAVTTYPQGADVYVASLWMGTTPLFLPLPAPDTSLTLKMESFRDLNFYNLEGGLNDLRATFPSNQLELTSFIDEQRDDVYTALGFFAISIPFPVILYNLSTEYADALNRIDSVTYLQEAQGLFRKSSVFYYSYIGTLIISASLFINSIVHLVQYLAAVESG